MNPGPLDTRIRIEYSDATQDADYGTPVPVWTLLAVVWANVQDELPSRSEAVKQRLDVATSQTRVRYRFRQDVDSSMRIVIGSRILQIIAPPAELGRHEYSEVVCESAST